MALKTYYVDPNRNLRHGIIGKDGEPVETDYAGGEPVKMDELEAAPLIEAGILLKDKPERVIKKELAQVESELADALAEIETLKANLEAAQKEIETLKTPAK